MTDHSRKAAWLQATLLLAAFAVVGVVLVARLQRPFDRDTLAIQVGQLQSQSAEAALLARNAIGDRLAPGFTRQHVRQLADAVGRVQDALQSKPAQPALAPFLASARQSGAGLHAVLQPWTTDARLASPSLPELDRLDRRLDALGKQLKPGT